jgi:predicted metal-dependent HD superfamily phosphohydrolase
MDLLAAWLDLCERVGAHGDCSGVGRSLVDAYAGPDRAYHDVRHLAEVLEHVDALAGAAAAADLVRLAAWFHDAVYDTHVGAQPAAGSSEEGAESSEERSARLATERLLGLGLDEADVTEVARLVRLTATHDPELGDADGAVLCDADLAVLARDPAGYAGYVAAVRQEYAHVPDPLFRTGRAAILRALLDQPQLFRTPTAAARWEARARANVTAELTTLDKGAG